jgi:ankyrin repeat protein
MVPTLMPENDGKTPLHIATSTGHKKAVSLLLEKGANVNAKDRKEGRTPLHVACCRNARGAIVSLLLEKGANIHAKEYDGRTPLHRACEYGHENIILLLLDKGADVNAKDVSGNTWKYATSQGLLQWTRCYRFIIVGNGCRSNHYRQ